MTRPKTTGGAVPRKLARVAGPGARINLPGGSES